MVDLGQKGWKKFHLFYWNKLKYFNFHIISDHVQKLGIKQKD